MTEKATGGIVSVGQPVVLGEHGCSIRFRGRQVTQTVPAGWFDGPAEPVITGSFRIEVPADTLAVLESLPETGPPTDEDEWPWSPTSE